MAFYSCIPEAKIALFVKNILVFEESENVPKTILPFFADGYPGLMFQQTSNGLRVNPHDKEMPALFLYGQTIQPIELVMEGKYKLMVFQLYPFVLKSFFNINPKDINDNCFNLEELNQSGITTAIEQLQNSDDFKSNIEIITSLLYRFFEIKKNELDLTIRQAIQCIDEHQGQLSIADLCHQMDLNERTLERKFISQVGISAKQFSKIIQFQQSLEQLTVKDYKKLTDIVYANGFSDQSHFIKVFKAFTGKTPKKFQKNN